MAMTLYLAGAGLSKSLQSARSVPLMMDFTRVLTEFVSNDVVLNTLVVMELGGVYENSCSECKQLAEQIGKDVPKASADERDRFAELVRSRQPESIETLFDRIETTEPTNIYASGLPAYFRYAINQVFVGIGWDLEMAVLERFLRARFKDRGEHVFVSFNYDLVLDKCIEFASDGMWQPRNGYGFEFPFYAIVDPASEHPGDAVAERSSLELPLGVGRFRLIKPHGSLNWLVPQGKSGAVEPAEMLIPLTRDLKIRHWPPTQTFNYTQHPGEWPRDMKILIAPPSSQKSEVLRRATSDEFDALTAADEIFVLGYSFPKTDRDQMDLVQRAVNERRAPISRATVVNYKAPQEYFEGIEDLLKPREMRSFNAGFADFAANAQRGG
jgi:hypothetical protein